MREPLTLFEQSNIFKKLNRQRLPPDYIARNPFIYSSLNNVDDTNVDLKSLSFDVYTSKYLPTTGKTILPYSRRHRLDEILLPAIEKDINRQENHRARKKKPPSYCKSLLHLQQTNSTQADLTHLTARGTKPDTQIAIPIVKDDETVVNFQSHHAPPPSPSDDEIERLLYDLEDGHLSPLPSWQSTLQKEGLVPFRLPALNRYDRRRHKPVNALPKDVRTTLSDFLQKYY